MKFYEFGELNKPVIILLPGTCCHWKANFEKVIPFLAEDFHVICVSYDGFDETEKTIFHGNVFPDMVTETDKIENYIKENYGGKIHVAYGCSLGGSFVGLLVQRRNVHISHAILGSSDLVTPIENGISVSGTTIHIFYAVKMGERYLERYHRHFKNPDIRRHDMQHEELLICYPEQWVEEVKKCCGV
ncbi:MAG: alpha/beta hydrolase [Lachnospiraceae bacterium]|nr:alpha/beta hydrolase [Lachnospiraceae bacterium]